MKKRKKRKSKISNTLKIFYSNPRGIRSKELSLQATVNKMNPDIIILVDAHLVKKNSIKINGYDNVITRNRNTNGGGLLVAQRNNLDSKLVILDINQTHEQMWLQLTGPNGKINFCVEYGFHESRCTKQEIED